MITLWVQLMGMYIIMHFIFVLCFGIAVVTGEVCKDLKDIKSSKMEVQFFNVACCNTSKGNPPEKTPPQHPPETVIPPQPSENQPQQEPGIVDPPQQEPDVKPKVSPPFKKCSPPGRYLPCYLMVVLTLLSW